MESGSRNRKGRYVNGLQVRVGMAINLDKLTRVIDILCKHILLTLKSRSRRSALAVRRIGTEGDG